MCWEEDCIDAGEEWGLERMTEREGCASEPSGV